MQSRHHLYFLATTLFSSYIVTAQAVCPVPGSGIVVNGTTDTETGCTITTSATNANGANANLGGTINFSDGSISTTGTTANGAYANGTGSTINLVNIPISTTGAGSYGAYANGTGSLITLDNVTILTSSANGLFLNGGQINFNTGSITTNGASTNGAQILGPNALLNLENVNVQVNGTSGVGVFVQLGGNTANITNCTITTTANGDRGVDVGVGSGAVSSATISNCIINTALGSDPPSFGSVVARNGSSVSVTDSTINTEVYGVHSIGVGASITVDNSVINVTPQNSTLGAAVFGAYAQDQTTITLQNNTKLTTTGGLNAHGFAIQDGSTGNVFNSSISTSGPNAQAVFMLGFSIGNQVNILNSTVETSGSGANAIQSFAAAGIINNLQATNSSFSAANDDLILIAGGLANMMFTDVTALASNGHNLLLVDGSNPATLNWTADSSNMSGDMQVVSGNVANVILGNSTTWTGAALDVTDLAVNTSDWNLTANSTITNQLINSGLIDYVSEGDVFKTLTVSGSYVGQDGTIGLNTFLGGDGSPSDLLILNGSPATGSTFLNIKNTTGEGELTFGNGILVVDAINGGTTTSNAFSLANYVVAGPYEYTLFRGSVDGSGPENWYLRSDFESNSSVLPIPNYRSEVSLYTALPSMVLLYGRALMDTLHQRVGEEEQLRCRCQYQSDDLFSGAWIRLINEGGFQRGRNIFHHGPNFHYHFWAVQGGFDLYCNTNCDGSRDYIGVLGAIGSGRGSVRHFTHKNAGHNKFDVYTGGFYCTHFGCSGWYLDGLVELNRYDHIRCHSRHHIPKLRTHGYGVAASIEGGYPFRFNCFILEPQAQVVYQRIHLHKTRDIAANVHFRHARSTAGRAGVRLANTWDLSQCSCRQLTIWARTSIWNEFERRSKTYFSSQDGFIGFGSKLQGLWLQGDLGVTAQVTDIISLYGTFGGNLYLNGRGQAYNVDVGIRANF